MVDNLNYGSARDHANSDGQMEDANDEPNLEEDQLKDMAILFKENRE